jgi:putative membrane protein
MTSLVLKSMMVGLALWGASGPGTALAQRGPGGGGYGGGYGGSWGPHMMFGGGWWGWIMMILFWALIIAGVVALAKWLFSSSRQSAPGRSGGSALDILKERYARGEITKDEFEQMKKDILAG